MSRPAAFLSGCVFALIVTVVTGYVYLQHAAGGFSARQPPTRMEAMLARTALRAAMPSNVATRTNPVAPSAEVLHEAMAHYADHCAVCHANNGSGDTMLGNGMYPRPPDLRLALTQNKTDGELFSIIENGIRMSGMPAFGSNGGDKSDTWKLVLFLRRLPRLTAAEEHEMQHLNPKSPDEINEEKQEQDFLNGSSE